MCAFLSFLPLFSLRSGELCVCVCEREPMFVYECTRVRVCLFDSL